MTAKNLSYDELLQIVKVFENSPEFNEFHLKYGDVEVDLRKHGATSAASEKLTSASIKPSPVIAPSPAQPSVKELTKQEADSASTLSIDEFSAGACLIKSAMVGTFYRAPEPGGQPFVSVGQRVTPDTTVCIIEVMKLMTSIQAGCAGVVTHILVGDGEPVEFGQTLIAVAP